MTQQHLKPDEIDWGNADMTASIYVDDACLNSVVLAKVLGDLTAERNLARAYLALEARLATAEADCAVMRAFAKAHEKWEANLINSNEAWAPDGMAEFPRLTAPLYDEFMEVQRLRNAALARPTGQAILAELSAARKVCEVAEWQENGGLWPENYADALDAYRAARKANT